MTSAVETITLADAAHTLDGAVWIEPVENEELPWGQRPGYEFTRIFDLSGAVSAASLSATAHGIYEAYLNGVRVGNDELSPGLTSYTKTLYVQEHDVRTLLREGQNELRLVLTDGWFRGRTGPSRIGDNYGTRTAVIAKLSVKMTDTEIVVVTDESWKVRAGEIVTADLMDGQAVDLTRRDRDDWGDVGVARDPLTADRSRLAFSPSPPVRRMSEHRPASITRLPGGRQIVDFGQNLNGWVRLQQLGPAGSVITLTHGEALDASGDLTMSHLAYTEYPNPDPLPTGQIDTVTSRGVEGDFFEPRHTTHGFQYVAVDGLAEDLVFDAITAVFVYSDLDETGTFSSSNDRVNRLHEIAVASWHSNACDVPTDCPQRERWGYTGDYQIFVRTASFLDDIEGFSRKWLRSLADDQRPDGCVPNVAPSNGVVINPAIPFSFDGSAGWGDAATIVPWQIYETYGDATVLRETFDMMTKWVDYAAGVAAQGRHDSRVERSAQPAAHEQFLWDSGFHWGEWLEPDASFDFSQDVGIIATAYLYRSASIVSQAATVLGNTDAAERYGALATDVQAAWQTEFIDARGRLTAESQANYVRALAFGLVPADVQERSVDRLVELIRDKDTHLSTGFLSTALLLPTLAANGHSDIAYELLLRDSEPSWMTMLDQGATTIWESWSGIDENGNPHESLNHYSKGGVISFLHEYVAGIRATAPGYRTFTVAPKPGGDLTSARAALRTRHGEIDSAWEIADDRFSLTVAVPAGTTATIVLPSGAEHAVVSGRHRFAEAV